MGNLFQLTYNAVDSIIVGRFIGKEALAAIGTSSPIMNIIILGISGICVGASVLMSEFFGGQKYNLLKKEMSTLIVFGVYFSIFIVALGIALSPLLLRVLNVPKEIHNIANIYLRIIFLGAPFTYFYNAIASALKSVGDSKTPLKFLAFCSILNGVLDYIFIGILGFGIICSAITTVIAEMLSALLCFIYVYYKYPLLQIKFNELSIDRGLLKSTLQYGSVTALQQVCQPVGKLLIQGSINSMGINAIAAFNAVTRVDDYAFSPEQSISHGITTFVAQNRGTKQEKRIKAGFITGLTLEFYYWILICLTILLLKERIMILFIGNVNNDVIQLGCDYLSLMAIFYLLPAFTNGIQGFFRGMGNMSITLLGTFIQTSLRVIFVYLLIPTYGMHGVAYACAIGWSVMLLVEVPYYFYFMKNCKKN